MNNLLRTNPHGVNEEGKTFDDELKYLAADNVEETRLLEGAADDSVEQVAVFKSFMETTTHNDSVEGLRGIAVVLTQICHISIFDYRHLEFFTGKGGVAIFFVLSGYLITGNLLKLQVI
jgi:hypothetical protein